ncbi:MAG: hypothetical protein ACRD0W_12165 [Acidimicrobiales bacterium]
MADVALWINASAGAPSYDATELRQAMAFAFGHGGGQNLGARSGVRPGGTQLETSIAGSTITVQEGVACLYEPTPSVARAPYWVALPADETHTLTAAHATNPRKDITVLRVYDHDQDSSGLRLARSEYLVGTPAPTPSEPAVPAGAFKLALIDVPAQGGGSPVVTINHPFAVASGGIVPVRDATEEAALSLYDGQMWYRLDTDELRARISGVSRALGFSGFDVQIFTGNGTWTKPAGARFVRVRMVGGGGGGGVGGTTSAAQGSCGGCGGSGEYGEKVFAASALGATESVVIGAGGAGGVTGSGSDGSTSSFDDLTAIGGTGGGSGSPASNVAIAGGAGGTGGAGGGLHIRGETGDGGRVGAMEPQPGRGGSSHLGPGAPQTTATNTGIGTAAAANTGGGGSSGFNRVSQSLAAGGAGGSGLVIAETTF